MTHFYIHLPSNSSEAFYPNNTMAEYVTRLMNRVELDGDWEVGLSEILFSKNWYNIRKKEALSLRFVDSSLPSSGFKTWSDIYHQVSIGEGYYTSPAEIVDELNSKIQNMSDVAEVPVNRSQYHREVTHESHINKFLLKQQGLKHLPPDERKKLWPTIKYNSHNNKVVITLGPSQHIRLSPGLKEALGFGGDSIKSGDSEAFAVVESNRVIDLNSDLQAFYVYCDIVDSVRVGDTERPLLRIVETGSEPAGTLVKRQYLTPLYVPVRKKNFEHIEIKLLTDSGKPVPFQRGRVIITLHFRKSERNYFV